MALDVACMNGHNGVLLKLLEFKCKSVFRDEEGNSILHQACYEADETKVLAKKQLWDEQCTLCGLESCEPHPGMSMVAMCVSKGCRHPAMTGEGDRCLGCDTRLSTLLDDASQE